jgi:alkylation response protein AidB-like acyl-CoA dehydrogenase
VNKGWDVAKYLLGHEREMISGMGLGGSGSLGAAVKPKDALLRAEIAAFDVDSLAFAAMSERFAAMWKAGEAHPASPSMMKYAGTELNKRRNELMMAAGGSDALEWDSERSKSGKPARDWLRSKGNSIEGGTSEIQLNIVAKHILGLPGA